MNGWLFLFGFLSGIVAVFAAAYIFYLVVKKRVDKYDL